MNDEILDDFQIEQEEVVTQLWKYRVIGITRLFFALFLLVLILAMIISNIQYQPDLNEPETYNRAKRMTELILLGIGFFLLGFAFIYHIRQGFAELRYKLYSEFAKKRRFRNYSIGLSVFLMIIFGVSFVFAIIGGNDGDIIFPIVFITFILTTSIITLITDRRYSKNQ